VHQRGISSNKGYILGLFLGVPPHHMLLESVGETPSSPSYFS
jgi:hypothetical protein